MSNIHLVSEIAPLAAVLVHRPGPEVERMSPQAARAALYDDIIHLPRAQQEHDQLTAALRQFAQVHEVATLLAELLEEDAVREALLEGLCTLHGCPQQLPRLRGLPAANLAHQLIQGTPAAPSPLADLSEAPRYALPPLHNLYFTRDAAMCVGAGLIVGAMATRERRGEALLMRLLFEHHRALRPAALWLDGSAPRPEALTMEGGDVLPLRDDLLLVGLGDRTSALGVETLLGRLSEGSTFRHVVVQPIPRERAYIHLDMVFTLLDHDLCAVHAPVILAPQPQPTLLAELRPGQPPRLTRHKALLPLLADLGMPLTPLPTGGSQPLFQAREQWQKGTNFFAMAPGKVIGYARNEHTYRELETHGFRIVAGEAVQRGAVDLTAPGRVAVAMEGAELSRGGGGCRCMTLPLRRHAAGTGTGVAVGIG